MPILEYHLTENQYSDAQCEKLLVESSKLYAEILKSPLDRVRVVIHEHKASKVAVGGVMMNQGGKSAPFFFFLALLGRPENERHALLTGFTDLVVNILGAERAAVRGGCWTIPPEDWAIGGTPASVLRAAEVRARAEAAAKTQP
ncbi:4-oxalocrotonate tautomerase [Panacagrimonas perspica]|uniref:4-oxalocrotonate tautomerase n=1 Tax=Panacagrimonas perspica TaxID=381431 RepID=A0A4S3K9T6_9GAMM|nr:tautomerase family protein [Panacagrimonas perspica]TDU28582.1 4-oxalocrotonate tautomerase [Panacagrimonas perspica]THD04918.1 4-oxalocrotonate tautomerase [Panacagrimonas perspica]